jgi:RNA polymerase sigma-70 factor (ECF subfamily)
VEAFVSADPDPEQQALAGEARSLLEESIASLPPLYRAVFVMREVEGLDTAETAECLEVSDEVVKTRLRRARALLRHALFERAGVATSAAFSFHLSRCDRVVARVLDAIVPRSH